MAESYHRRRDLVIACLAVALIPTAAALLAMPFGSLIEKIDPDGSFLWLSVHHVFQLILTVLLIKVLFKGRLREWGFNLRQLRLSLIVFGVFSVVYLLPVFLHDVLPVLRSGSLPEFSYSLTAANMGGVLSFQFLLSGTCEEPLFRGFVMTLLARSWKGALFKGRFRFPVAGVIATALFMLAHAKISLSPFSIGFSFWQQVWAFGLGVYYAAVFSRTGSLLAPMLSHGYSNGIIFVIEYTMAKVMR